LTGDGDWLKTVSWSCHGHREETTVFSNPPHIRGQARRQRYALLRLEPLECRDLPSAVTVNAGIIVRPVNNHVLGVNVDWWDTTLNTAQTQQLVQSAGLSMFRFPGGSSSDTWHFSQPPNYAGEGTSPGMAQFIASVGGAGMVTLDYGSGSPQEAAAFLAYLNAAPSSTVAIGPGLTWDDASNQWVTRDWKTAGYWASLRVASPLPQDDGLNFLRIHHATFDFAHFEVGNEVYGSWETDHHGTGTNTGQPHDPATYVAFAKRFAAYATQISPFVRVGLDVGSPYYDSNWPTKILQQCATLKWTPGYLSDHNYMQSPGNESDSYLLLDTVSDPNGQNPSNPLDWAGRAAEYRKILQQELGSSAAQVSLLATEVNSITYNPGKQTTSLVEGLFVADSIGSILQTEYNACLIWDLRNGWFTAGNNSPGLYGWRQGGDYGLLGSGNSPPATGASIAYPSYFAEQLSSHMVHQGDNVVRAVSSDPYLSVYAVKQGNGHLDLLVINKNASANLTGSFQVSGFQPAGQATVWQYGKAQDTAQSKSSNGGAALAHFSATLLLSGSNFSYSFPSYSMTVLDLTPQATGPAASASSAVLAAPTLDVGSSLGASSVTPMVAAPSASAVLPAPTHGSRESIITAPGDHSPTNPAARPHVARPFIDPASAADDVFASWWDGLASDPPPKAD
jgi:alpha-L-arabinofuranosidase